MKYYYVSKRKESRMRTSLSSSGQLWDFYRPETQWQAVTRDKCQISIHLISEEDGDPKMKEFLCFLGSHGSTED